MIIYSFNKKEEEKTYQRWILEGYSKQISFEDYKDELFGNKKENNYNYKKETNNNNKKERKLTNEDRARLDRLDI